jgi:3-phosphoshikimate 1-carboxyvinyltransferase
MKIVSAMRLRGTTDIPGDKSISHRAALIAALADGTSVLENFSTSHDCDSTLSCLSELGVKVYRERMAVRVRGSALRPPADKLDCGNSGSTMRMMAGLLAAQSFESTLIGDASLSARPMNRIIEPLEKMGAQLRSNHGHPPLHIRGRDPLMAITYEMPIASAQVKTSLLLAGLRAHGRTVVTEAFARTRDHTERMLKWFGVSVETTDEPGFATTAVDGPVRFKAANIKIPGDFSSAAYLISAAAMLPGSELEIKETGLNPTRTQLLDVLRSVGLDIETFDTREECNEPVGTIRVRGKSLQQGPSNVIDRELTAAIIDELPLLAVVGSQVPGGLVFRDAGELRVKETDRIAASVKNLRAMGAAVEEFDDGLAVNGPVRLKSATIPSYGDHRIAMAFSIAALAAEGESEIIDSECVAVSFPDFFARLASLVER